MSLRYQPNYEAARKRAASLAARPFVPRTRIEHPTRRSRVLAVMSKGAKVAANIALAGLVIGALVFVILVAVAADQQRAQIHRECILAGRVVYRGLCLEPETAQRIILDNEGYRK